MICIDNTTDLINPVNRLKKLLFWQFDLLGF